MSLSIPLENIKNQKFSDIFKRYKKRPDAFRGIKRDLMFSGGIKRDLMFSGGIKRDQWHEIGYLHLPQDSHDRCSHNLHPIFLIAIL